MIVCLIGLYLLLLFLPNLLINSVQYRHIKMAMKEKAVLLSPKDYVEAGEYALAKLRLAFVIDSANFLFFIFWIVFGLKWVNALFVNISNMQFFDEVSTVLGFLCVSHFFSLFFKYYQEMVIDKKFGFSKQSMRLFLADSLKSLGLILILGGSIVYILIFLMNALAYWWLWGAMFVLSIMIAINFLYPTLIAPLFNTFTPLQDPILHEKIESLMKNVGFESSGIFVMDASKRDGRLNAYFGGFGKNKRVVLFDTLLEKVSSEGLIAILGHELGHFKHKDLIFNVLIQSVFLFTIFYLIGSLPNELFIDLSLPKTSANLLIFLFLFVPLIAFWFLPVVGFFTRRAEFRADQFGATLSSSNALAQALVRLVNENKSFPSSHPIYIYFHYTHPPLLERLKALSYEFQHQ